jgi:TolA-binding protein
MERKENKIMKKLILAFLIVFISINLQAEPSVFGAGNLSIDNPYGLTKTEKVILENKESIKDLEKANSSLRRLINKNSGSINTIKNLVNNVGKKTHEHKLKINSIMKDIEHLMSVTNSDKQLNDRKYVEFQNQQLKDKKKINEALKTNFESINTNIEDFIKKQNKNFDLIGEELKKLELKINSLEDKVKNIDQNYATQKQINFVIKEFNVFKEAILKEFETALKSPTKKEQKFDFSRYSNVEIFKQAKSLISMNKYEDAIKHFKHLISKHYRPASSNYYIGEAYYLMEDFKKAIFHYKESVSIYSQSKFMPTLLLHTGISFQKTDDDRNARNFLELLVSQYQNAPESVQARQILKSLK